MGFAEDIKIGFVVFFCGIIAAIIIIYFLLPPIENWYNGLLAVVPTIELIILSILAVAVVIGFVFYYIDKKRP